MHFFGRNSFLATDLTLPGVATPTHLAGAQHVEQ